MKYKNPDIWKEPKILKHKCIVDGDPKPIHIQLELTKICNHSCVFCYHHGIPRKGFLDDDVLKGNKIFPKERLLDLIDEMKTTGVKAISFTGGGEPLLHPNIYEVMSKIYIDGIEFGITTNLGIEITNKDIETLSKASWITCSLNASYNNLYQIIHNPKNKSTTGIYINNLKRLIKIGNSKINISFVICEGNKDDILDIATFVKILGVNSISYRPDVAFNRSNIYYDKQTISLLEKAKKLEEDDFRVNIGYNRLNDCKEINEDLLCYFSRFSSFITTNGDVYPCCMTECDTKYMYGNIMNTDFKEFWNSTKRKDNYKMLNMRYCPLCRHEEDNRILESIYKDDINNFI